MRKRFSFEFKITGILLIILSLLTLTGVFAYKRFSKIITEISEKSRPDSRLLTAEALLNDINSAEISVQTFMITNDTLYLEQFYLAAQAAENRLSNLQLLGKKNRDYPVELDSLDEMLDQKITLLTELLLLQDEYRLQNALEKVAERVRKNTPDIDGENQNTTSSTIIDRLFKKRKKDSLTTAQIDSPNKVSIVTVDQEVEKIQKEEKYMDEIIKKKEITNVKQGQILREKIIAVIEDLREFENDKILQKSKDAEAAIHRTNQQIALFCFTTSVLLLFMTLIIVNYVRNNNRYRKALRNAKREAENLAAAKQSFLANMSHEIRTPMNAIAGFTEQLAAGPLTLEQKDQLSMVSKSTDHLLHLINEVLDFSKLQSDKLKLEKIGFRPVEIVKEVVAIFKSIKNNPQLIIEYEFDEKLPKIILGDPFRLRQILLNLVSNSVKFTEKGTIKINVKSNQIDKENTLLKIEVIDTGVGMNKNNLTKVFHEFEQAESSTSRNYGGTGLGLSIVNMLIHLHKGTILLESEENIGTKVTVEIPYQIGAFADLELAELTDENIEETDFSHLKILIVDDVEYNRKLLKIILAKNQIKFGEATNGNEAIVEHVKNNYDLILMDSRMPELNGIEATLFIRKLKDPTKKKIPIIALTAAVSVEDRSEYQVAGMNGFLSKPFKENELLLEISQAICPEFQKRKKIDSKSAVIVSSVKLNFYDLEELSNGDMKFYIDMLQTFIDSTARGIEEIKKAMSDGNWKRMADQAHKISAPCNHLNATQLFTYLKEIETIGRDKKTSKPPASLVNRTENEAAAVIAFVQKELGKYLHP